MTWGLVLYYVFVSSEVARDQRSAMRTRAEMHCCLRPGDPFFFVFINRVRHAARGRAGSGLAGVMKRAGDVA